MVPEIWRVFVILDHFLTFYIPNNPENQNFEKMKKAIGDVIILDMRTKNHNHMMYGSWGMKHDRQNFLSFWAIFCPFTSIRTRKSKFWKNEKKIPEDIIIYYFILPGDMARDGCNFYFSFWAIFFTKCYEDLIKLGDKVFKNGTIKIWERQPLTKIQVYGLFKQIISVQMFETLSTTNFTWTLFLVSWSTENQ